MAKKEPGVGLGAVALRRVDGALDGGGEPFSSPEPNLIGSSGSFVRPPVLMVQ